jgi:hypothetical protein
MRLFSSNTFKTLLFFMLFCTMGCLQATRVHAQSTVSFTIAILPMPEIEQRIEMEKRQKHIQLMLEITDKTANQKITQEKHGQSDQQLPKDSRVQPAVNTIIADVTLSARQDRRPSVVNQSITQAHRWPS